MTERSRHRLHAARVAVAATAIVVACYVLCAFALSVVVGQRLTAEADAHIAPVLARTRTEHLGGAGRASQPSHGSAPSPGAKGDLDDAPVFVWRVGARGATHALTVGAPALPPRRWSTTPVTLTVGGSPFRFETLRAGSGWLVGGQSVLDVSRVRAALFLPELLFGILLAAATFAGALVVGLRASAPIDLIRRRQAAFTADASHELRTPLSVVEAEVDLALRRRRTPDEYEAVLGRIAGEGRRLRRIVEDLLWLARADSGAAAGGQATRADVGAVVSACVERFRPVAQRRGVRLDFRAGAPGPATIAAAPELVDRLAGVLVDNACKFAGDGGVAVAEVRASGSRVVLRVDDSGPGIPPEDRTAVFDRFHRSSGSREGAGLGLAIADSVVRMTGGTWSVEDAPLGGARMEVSWRRVSVDVPPAAAPGGRRAAAAVDTSRGRRRAAATVEGRRGAVAGPRRPPSLRHLVVTLRA